MSEPFGVAAGRVVAFLLARRRASIVGAAIVAGLLALAGSRVKLDADLAAFLPLDDPEIAEQVRALRAFRGLDTLRVDLGIPGEGAASDVDRSKLRAAATAFEAELISPLISRVSSGPSVEAGLALDDLARRSLPSLVEPAEVAAVLSRFSTDAAIEEQLERHRIALNSLEGAFLTKDHVRRDPLGLEAPFFEKLKALGQSASGSERGDKAFGGAHVDDGRIVSEDGRHVLFLIEPAVPASRTEDAALVLDLLERARQKASAAAGVPVKALVAGGHRASVENARAIQRDAWLTSLLSLAASLFVYALIFPRRYLIPLTLLPLAAGAFTGAALSWLIFGKVSAIAVGFGGIIIGLADDFVVLLYYCFETRSAEGGAGDPRVAAVERTARPLVAAGAAIAGAFLALAVSGFPGQRDLAFFAVTSLGGTLAFTLLVQPLLLPSGKSPRPLPDAAAPVRALVAFVEEYRKLALIIIVALTVALGLAATKLRFEDDPRAIDGASQETRAAEDELAKRFGDERGFVLVVARGPDLETTLERNDATGERLESLRASGEVESVATIAPLVPSAKTQEQRRAGWSALFTESKRQELTERLARLRSKHRFAARAFDPFFARIASAGEPIDVRTLASGPLAGLVRTRLASDERGWFLLTLVRTKASDAPWVGELERQGTLIGSRSAFARKLVTIIHRRLWACGALGFLVMIAVIVPALARPRLILAASLALGVGLVWSLGVLALSGTAINAVNFLIPVLVLGLNVDYAIFLASGYAAVAPGLEAARAREAQGGVMASGLTTIAGMASLLIASHPAVYSVGVVALFGTCASIAAVFVVTPTVGASRKR